MASVPAVLLHWCFTALYVRIVEHDTQQIVSLHKHEDGVDGVVTKNVFRAPIISFSTISHARVLLSKLYRYQPTVSNKERGT